MIDLLTLGARLATMDAVHRSPQSHTLPWLLRRRLLRAARQAPPAAARPRRKMDAVGRWTCCALLHICLQSKRKPSTTLQADTKSTKATVCNSHGDAQLKHSQSFEQRASSNITLSTSRAYGTTQSTGLDDINTPFTHTEAGATNIHSLRIHARSGRRGRASEHRQAGDQHAVPTTHHPSSARIKQATRRQCGAPPAHHHLQSGSGKRLDGLQEGDSTPAPV